MKLVYLIKIIFENQIIVGLISPHLKIDFIDKYTDLINKLTSTGVVISIIIFNVLVSKNTSLSIKFLGLVFCLDNLLNVLQVEFLKDMQIFGHVMGILGGLSFAIIYKIKKVTV